MPDTLGDPRIVAVDDIDDRDWLEMRQSLYPDETETELRRDMAMIKQQRHHAAFALLVDNQVVGLLELSLRNVVDGCVSSPVGYIESIWVSPELKGGGYGRQLVAFAEGWSREQGCSELGSDTWINDLKAQAFHAAVGFEEVDRVVGYRKAL